MRIRNHLLEAQAVFVMQGSGGGVCTLCVAGKYRLISIDIRNVRDAVKIPCSAYFQVGFYQSQGKQPAARNTHF